MEWQQLVGFHQVVTLGSFTKAAKATFRTQSALSQQIKSLEGELDCVLFERIGRHRIRITKSGEVLFLFVKKIFAEYDNTLNELNRLKGRFAGHLTISVNATSLFQGFAEAIKKYTLLFPEVELSILDRQDKTVIQHVIDGSSDFGLTFESLVPKDLDLYRYKKIDYVLLVRKDSPLTRVGKITLKEISGYPLILPTKTLQFSHRNQLENMFQKEGLTYRTIIESSSVAISTQFVEAGIGVSMIAKTEDLKLAHADRFTFISLADFFGSDFIVIVKRRDKQLTAFKKAFIDLLVPN